MKLTLFTFVIMAALCLGALAQDPTPTPLSKSQQIDAAVKSWLKNKKAPALSLAIVLGDQIVFQRGWGMADIKTSNPAMSDTQYRLASITKTITAVAIMQLVEQGKINLDASIHDYCAAYPEEHYLTGLQSRRFTITVKQVLYHLSGIRHNTEDEMVNTKHFATLKDAIATFKDDPLVAAPGAQFSYSTPGYVVLGCAIETVSGQSYYDYIKQNILKPAGMNGTFVDDINSTAVERAKGYHVIKGGDVAEVLPHDTSIKLSAGGLVSSVLDMARFTIALENGKLVKPETLAEMWKKPPRPTKGRESNYAMGITVNGDGDGMKLINDGVQVGTRTYYYLLPKQKFAIILMTNLEGARCEELVPTLIEILGT